MADIILRRPRPLSRARRWPFGRLFEDLFEGFDEEFGAFPELWAEGRFVPAIDVTEDQDALTLQPRHPGWPGTTWKSPWTTAC